MADDYYIKSYEDFKSMGLEGAATQVLLQGLRATNSSRLVELAEKDGIPLPEVGQQGYYQNSNEVLFPAPAALVEDGDELVKAFLLAQERHQDFVEATPQAWQLHGAKSWQDLKQQEEELRLAAREAFNRCKDLLMRRVVTMRPELLRAPITPDALPETQRALSQGGDPETALRKLLADGAGAFEDRELWSKEGPGRLLEQCQRMAELDALPARAKELAQTGPGSLSSLLHDIAVETSIAAKGCKDVLVLGGNGVSAVAAVRAMEGGKVVIWEPLEDVAHAACEVLKRNLGPDELARCRMVSGDLPQHHGGLVVVDRWHGLGVLGWSPLQALRVVLAASSVSPAGVIPSRLSISLCLADGGLGETQQLDLSAMDARFRALATGPLRVGGHEPHATSLQPKILTDFVQAFDYDLSSLSRPVDGPKSVAFSARPSKVAANCAVFECRFELPRSRPSSSLRFAQWLPGGLQLGGSEPKLCAWRNESRVWLEWDGAKSLYPPFGFMALSEWYFEMLRDSARHELYERALQVEIAKVKEKSAECKVLDVGSGDGILSLMALRAGATYGLGVECVAQIARASEEVIEANRKAQRVPATPLEIWCTDVRGIGERESEDERFEVLVSELMDASGLGENLILLTEGSKRRLCKANSSVIPAKLRLKAVLCEVKLPEIHGVNIDAFWPFWPLDRMGDALWLGVDLDKREGDFKVLTEPVELLSLRLGEADADAIPSRASYNFKGASSGTANMVVWWFEAQLSESDPSVVLTNAPSVVDGRHAPTCWGQAAAEISHVQVLKGENTEIQMEMTFGDYQLKFKTPNTAGDAHLTARFTPPPNVEDFSPEYQQVLKDYVQRQQSYTSFAKESRVGFTAIRTADVESVAVLQRSALAMALFPGSFGLEGTTANRVLVSWYTVGGEGRS